VILKQSPKEVISVRLFVEGGTANYAQELEGIEALAFQIAMQGGTKSKDKLTFNAEAESIGAHFNASTTYDYGEMGMTCILPYWKKSWDLFADAVLNPAFDIKEFKITQEQMTATAKQNESDPDAHLRSIAMKNAFGDDDYTKKPAGSAESLQNISLDAVKTYYKNTLGKSRAVLVVVGNVGQDDLTSKIKATLAKLPAGKPFVAKKRKYIAEGGIYIEDRDIATNYLRGLMSAPTKTDEDGVAMQIAMSILGDRFFVELRTKRSLSYAPAAFYSSGVLRNPYNAIYISTTDPKQAIEVMVEIINTVKKEGFTEKELTGKKQKYLTQYFMGQETSSAQANELGMAAIAGDWKITETINEKVNALTLNDVNKALDKYTYPIAWTYLGKEDQVKKEDFKQTAKPKVKRHY